MNWNMVITFERLVRFEKSFQLGVKEMFCNLLKKTPLQFDLHERRYGIRKYLLCNLSKTWSPILKLFIASDLATMVSG